MKKRKPRASLRDEGDRHNALEVAKKLQSAFAWVITPQGGGYWSEVHGNLLKLAGRSADDWV